MVVKSSSIARSSHQNAADRTVSSIGKSDEVLLVHPRSFISTTTPRDSLGKGKPRQTRSAILREVAMKKKASNPKDNEKSRSGRNEIIPKRFLDKVKDNCGIRENKGSESRNPKELRSLTSSTSDVNSLMKQRAERRAASRGINNITKRGTPTRPTTVPSRGPTRALADVETTVIPEITTGHSGEASDLQQLWSINSEEKNESTVIGARLTTDKEGLNEIQTRSKKDTSSAMTGDDDSIVNMNLETKPSEISIVRSRDSDETRMSKLPHQQKFPNLHLDLAACAWEKLHQQLEFLSHNPKLAIPTIALTYPEDGATPLHTASWKAPSALALMVIRLLPATETGNEGFLQVDMDGNTPLHLCCANLSPFYNSRAANNSCPFLDLSVLEQLLQRAPEALTIKNGEGDTPLHLFVGSPAACYSDDLSEESSCKALSMILDHFSSPLTAILQDCTGATPLHVAVANDANKLIVAKLLEAAPKACMVEDDQGMVPLHYVGAFLNVQATVVGKMLEVYPLAVCHKTENGDTPLHLAVRNMADAQSKNRGEMESNMYHMYESMIELDENTRDVVNLLISCNGMRSQSNEDERKNKDKGMGHKNCALLIANREKLTPLHCCALFNAPKKLTYLLMKHPYSLRAASMQNAFGATALHLAVAQQAAGSFVDTALAVGTSEAAVVQDKLKRTALHVATQNIHATRQLIQGLVELNSIACTKKTQRGHLPLHIAAQSQAKEPVIDALISAFPAGTEMKNKSNNTPLHDAAKYHASSGVVHLLLKQYPEAVYIQNQYGNLPLHCATAYQAPSQIVAILLKAWPHGASIQNRNEDCPLHYAAAYATSADALQLLVDAAPASVLVLNTNGQSPIAKAKANDAPGEVIEMLERAGEDWTSKALDDGWGDFS